jgi:putative ATP-dependent endonuclease of the OLD family
LFPERIDGVIEVVDVGGKGNLKKFRKYLEVFQIPNIIIADLDYLKIVGSAETKKLFVPRISKVKTRIQKKGNNSDTLEILTSLDTLLGQAKASYSDSDLQPLKELWVYMLERHSSIKTSLDVDEKKGLDKELKNQKAQKVYIISSGAIESLFGRTGHFDMDSAVAKALDINRKTDVPKIIKEALTAI